MQILNFTLFYSKLNIFFQREENGKPLTSAEKENIENEVESLNAKLSKTEMHFEKLEILENEFEAEMDYAVNQELPESARMLPATEHRINFSMSDKSFFELDENNKLIEKEPYLKRINLDKAKERYVEIEINSKSMFKLDSKIR